MNVIKKFVKQAPLLARRSKVSKTSPVLKAT